MFSPCTKNFVRVIALLALCSMFTVAAVAQSTTAGAIGGVVTDQSGAVIPGAKIEVRNTGTNDVMTATSSEDGNFRIANVAPGTYDVKVTAGGFADYKASRLVVEVGRVSNVDAKLKVSGGGEVVEVVDEAPVINTERQDFANNINQEAIQNLPINGRRWSNYALLTPTANPDGTFGLISFRGISGIMNNSTVDGGDNNSNFYGEERGRTRLSYSTSQDAVREFQVNTSNFSAEYGRSAGGVVNTVTKSGTNSLHGSGYWYFRDNELGAANTTTAANAAITGTSPKPTDRRQQWGATLGGPIVKDRAFFFFNYDQQKRNFPGLAIPFNPTTVTNIGLVSYGQYTVSDPVAAGKAACPASGTLPSSGTGAYTVGQAIFCRFGGNAALGQAAANAGFTFITSLLGPNPRTGDQLIFFPKVDLKVLGGNWATSYNWLNWTSPGGIQTQPTNTIARDQFGNDLVRARTVNSIFNRAMGSSAAMELRFHWSSENLIGDFQEALPGQPSQAGPTGSRVPGVSLANWLNFGTQTYLPRPSNPLEQQYQFGANFTFTHGKHNWKIGGEVLHQKEEVQSLFQAYGTFGYTGSHAWADFLADAYNAAAGNFTGSGIRRCGGATPRPCYANLDQSVGTLGYKFNTNDYAMYIQDDWKIHPRFTMNLGLRYERQAFPDPQFPHALLPQTGKKTDAINSFGPRGGFAWDLRGDGKLVFRGGSGLYYGRIINSTIAASLVNTGNTSAQPNYRVSSSSTVGQTLLYPNILTSATGLTVTPNVVFFDPKLEHPMIIQNDAIIEWEFMKNTVASVSYLNSMGRGLLNFLDTNLPAGYTGNITYTRPDGSTFLVPTYGTVARPNTSFAQITRITNSVDSDYNAVVLQLTRRMTNNWQLQSSYTFSKATDNGQNSTTFSTGNNALDPANPRGEYGRSNFDVPHKFVFAAVWQPMFFKGQNNAAHYILDDWTLAPILNFTSGFAYTGTIGGTLPTGFCHSTHTGGINCANPGINRPPDVEKNTFRTTARQTIDFRIGRGFRVTEGSKIEFMAEAFNLFNRSNVSGVNSGQYSLGTCTLATNTCALTANSSFGVPSTINGGTNLRERQIQFALRFSF